MYIQYCPVYDDNTLLYKLTKCYPIWWWSCICWWYVANRMYLVIVFTLISIFFKKFGFNYWILNINCLNALWVMQLNCCFVGKWLVNWSQPSYLNTNKAIMTQSQIVVINAFFLCFILIVMGCYFVPSVSEFSIMFSSAADGDFSLSALPWHLQSGGKGNAAQSCNFPW